MDKDKTSCVISIDDAKNADFDALFEKLSSGPDGLAVKEAEERLLRCGFNEIEEKKLNPFIKLLTYFWGPIPGMIGVACVLSAAIGHLEDFGIILALLFLNVTVSFWHEYKADNAIELLKKKLAPDACVKRGNVWTSVPARQLVAGDMVRVRLGDIVPADLKLFDGDYLLVDESALTGESMPVEKHRSQIAYSGSVARQGEMDALVVATGMNTYFGRTARLVSETRTRSHFQKAIIKIGDYLIALALILVMLIFIVALFRHEDILHTLQFALVLTVAAIPVAMPAVLSVTMAVGAMALAGMQAIVSRLSAIEELAGMDVLCSDKTGTITKNEIVVAGIEPFNGFDEKEALICALLASKEGGKDPVNAAIFAKAGSKDTADASSYRVVKYKPFDPVSKMTEAEVEGSGASFKTAKGAPQVILALDGRDEIKVVVEKTIDEFARRGYRAIGVAKTGADGKWIFVGLIALYDPPREDSAQTIKTARSIGIDVKMVTGDHAAIAREISRELNLGGNIVTPPDFLVKSDMEARRAVEEAKGFAQVFPEHKYRIIDLLQSDGHIVGMTGDGVNDAPALKKAEAGIAVAGSTDAAKSAADIVLTKPGLSVIIDAIKQGRIIFQRMKNYAVYRITETIRVLLFMTLSILIFGFYPITAVMIVLLALLNDLPIMTIALDNVSYSDKPERWNMTVVLGVATVLGLLGVASSFGLFYIGNSVLKLNREVLQSLMYLKLSVAGHLTLFVARTRGPFWSTRPATPLLVATIGTQVLATIIVVYGIILPPVGWRLSLFVWGYALAWFVVNDLAKLFAYRMFEKGLLVKSHVEKTEKKIS